MYTCMLCHAHGHVCHVHVGMSLHSCVHVCWMHVVCVYVLGEAVVLIKKLILSCGWRPGQTDPVDKTWGPI